MGEALPPDHALAGIVGFGLIIRQANEAAMSITAAECVRDMTAEELQLAHDASEALSRLTRIELAQRQRG
jgi:hypothetical protein